MPFRVDRVSEEQAVVVRVAGELDAEAVASVEEVVDSADAGVTILDLAEVRYADRVGVRFLLGAEDRGIELRSGSPFLRELMARVNRSST